MILFVAIPAFKIFFEKRVIISVIAMADLTQITGYYFSKNQTQ